MKANLKGLSGIKGLLLLHGEKIGMAIVGLCAALFIYNSLQLKGLPDDMQADKLRQQMSQTKAAVEGSKWPDPGSEQAVVVCLHKPIPPISETGVEPTPFKTTQFGWDPAVITPTVPRTDPVLLAAIDVQAYGGCGLFAIIDEQVRKERALELEKEAEKKLQEEEKQRKKEETNTGGQPGLEGRASNRRGRGPGEPGFEVEDKEHPGRRPLDGSVRPPGVPLQGDENLKKTYWATVVAKVPIKDQIKLYRSAFENAKGGFDPATDFPRYFGFYVELAEVTRGQELKWDKVDMYDGQGNVVGRPNTGAMTIKMLDTLFQTIATKWAPPPGEVVDDRYLDFEGALVYPLPPLAWRDWGSNVTHPDIPLAINAPPREDETMPAEEQPTTAPGATEDPGLFTSNDPAGMPGQAGGFGSASRGPGPGGFSEMGGRGGFNNRRGGEFAGPGGSRGPEGGMAFRGRGPEGEMGGGARSFGAGRTNPNANRTTLPRGVDAWLVRFFDFTVEPGKKYKYRVRLMVHDPNRKQGLDPETLDSKAQARIKEATKNKSVGFRFTEWSEPSPTVGIPLDGSVRLADIKPSNPDKFSDEPTAKLLVESFGKDEKGQAIQAAKEADFRRGAVANMVSDAKILAEGGKAIDPIKTYRYQTGVTLVDVAGGDKLGKDLQAPSRALLMDPTGQLYVRNELDDHSDVELHRAIFNEDKKKNRREGEFGGPEGMGNREGRSTRRGP